MSITQIDERKDFMYVLAPSLLGADFTMLRQQILAVEEAGAGYLHLDVMDGRFVPNISFGMPVIASIRRASELIFDVHMMVREPERYICDLGKAGADIITVHQEACTHLDWTIRQIKEAGMKAGVAINPATPVSALDCILEQADMILVMTVNPGFGGQQRILYTLDKVKELRRMLDMHNIEADIEVDGGVTADNAWEFLDAGANVLVAGTSVFKGDAGKNTREFIKIYKEYEKMRNRSMGYLNGYQKAESERK